MSSKAEKAEKPDKKGDAHAADAGGAEKAAKKGGLLSKTPVLLGGVMVLEAVVLFAGFKFLGGSPKPAAAVEMSHDEGGDEKKPEGGHDDADKGHGDGAAKSEGHGEAGKGEAGKGEGGEPAKGGGGDPRKLVEVKILDYKAINRRDGRATLYDVAISVTTRGKHKPKIEAMVADRDGLIKDRVRTIIAQSDPEKLGGGSEPGLETFRRQVKYQLDEIVGEGLIDEVLVPRCIPYRAD